MIITSGSDNSTVAAEALRPEVPVVADTRGRLRVSKTQRRDILAALARSGESLPAFARRTGLKYSTLATWVQRHRPKRAGRPVGLRLLEAVVEPSPVTEGGAALALHLPGGIRVAVADEKQAVLAAVLVRALAQPC